MSHTDRKTMCDLVKRIRKVKKTVRRPIGILVDLRDLSCVSAVLLKGKRIYVLGKNLHWMIVMFLVMYSVFFSAQQGVSGC